MAALTATQVLELALGAGFTRTEANMMTVIADKESGWNPSAFGDRTLNANGSKGLWQIFAGAHSLSELRIKAYNDLYDPATNARAARIVFNEQGFGAWSTYKAAEADTGLLAKVSAIQVTKVPAPPVTPAPKPTPAPITLVSGRDRLRLRGNKHAGTPAALARAVAETRASRAPWHDLCLKWVRTDLLIPSGAPTAIAAWNATPAKERHTWYNPPAGVPVYWGGGQGHVAFSDGRGNVYSTDIRRAGHVDLVPIPEIEARWGKPYLGWTESLNGVKVYS